MGNKLSRLRPTVKLTLIVLLVLELITLPMVFGYTLAAPDAADHTLTYTKGSLTWDSDTKTDGSGVASLTLFSPSGDGFESDNGDNIIAPGTAGENTVRLQNQVSGSVRYTALLFRSDSVEGMESDLPVSVSFTGDGLTDTSDFALPDGLSKDELIRAVGGTLSGYGVQDFIIDWEWLFESEPVTAESADVLTGDARDTMLGNLSAEEKEELLTLRLYIVVEDDNDYNGQSYSGQTILPKTGDDSHIMWYLLLVALTLIALVVLLVDERRRKKWERLYEQTR